MRLAALFISLYILLRLKDECLKQLRYIKVILLSTMQCICPNLWGNTDWDGASLPWITSFNIFQFFTNISETVSYKYVLYIITKVI